MAGSSSALHRGPGGGATGAPSALAASSSICFVVSRSRSEYLRSIRTAISGLPLTMSPKISLPITMRSPSSTISAPAVRGMCSSMAISPKKSPFSSTATTISPWGTRFLMATWPERMMYMSSPSSPSLKRTVPLGKCLRNRAKESFSALIVPGGV